MHHVRAFFYLRLMFNLLTSKYAVVTLVVLLLAATHLYMYRSGTMAERDKWNERVAELEAKNKELSLKSTHLNKELVIKEILVPVEKVVTRNKIIKEEILIPLEKDCLIPNEVIGNYNRSLP